MEDFKRAQRYSGYYSKGFDWKCFVPFGDLKKMSPSDYISIKQVNFIYMIHLDFRSKTHLKGCLKGQV